MLVARDQTAAQLRASGLEVTSRALDASWHADVEVVSVLDEPCDVLVVATKAVGLGAALDRVAVAPGLVLPLLNGLDHMAPLRERFGQAAVVAAAIRIASDRPRTGVVEQTSAGARIDVAGGPPDASAVAEELSRAGLDVRVGGSEARVLWSKLVRLAALAAATSAFDANLGAIRADPAQLDDLRACVAEAAAVATAEGAPVDPAAAQAEIDGLRDDQGSSLWRDVRAGRENEREAILGAVLRAGARHGVPTPTFARLDALIAA